MRSALLSLAPCNSSGMVDYVTDIFILKPLDPTRSNHRRQRSNHGRRRR
jgi:hypothetical protein